MEGKPMRIATRTFVLALALMAGGAQAQAGTLTDPAVIANDDAAPASDFYAVRGRIDSGTDLVAAGLSSGATVSIFQANSTGGIVDLTVSGCGAPNYSAPCINAIFGPTRSSYYWSSSTYQYNPDYAWGVYFPSGRATNASKTSGYYVRAVRGGS